MLKQSCGSLTDTVVMVAPAQFGFNPETAQTNTFQMGPAGECDMPARLREAACSEFQRMVEILKSHQIRVLLLPSREDVVTPDAVFPNNWFSHHREDILVPYPMLAPSRRAERQPDRLLTLLKSVSCSPQVIDLAPREQGNPLRS